MARKQSLYGTVKGRVGDMGELVVDRAHELHEQTTEYIAENPIKSALILLGVGVVVGAIITKIMEKK